MTSNAPKEPLTALDFYAQARQVEEKITKPHDANSGARTRKLYEMEFNHLSDAEKATWNRLAKLDRIRYRKEMATYEPPVDSSSGNQPLLLMGRFFPFDSDGVSFADKTLTIKEAQNSSHIGEDGGTGLNVWDGAMLLVRYIEKVPNIVKNKVVVELGSGCGIVGIASAICGCKEVVMTDLSYALPLMKENVVRNRANWKDDDVVVCCRECDWFKPPKVAELFDNHNTHADVLLVADCVWLSSLVAPLLRALELYTVDSTEVYITYQQRGKEAHDIFMEGIHELFHVVDVDTLQVADLEKPDVFHMFHCKRKRLLKESP